MMGRDLGGERKVLGEADACGAAGAAASAMEMKKIGMGERER